MLFESPHLMQVRRSRTEHRRFRRMLIEFVCLSFLSILIAPAQAKFGALQLVDVPIARLLTNLEAAEKSCSDAKCKADIEYKIGRLYSMQYAKRVDSVKVDNRQADSKTVTQETLPGYEHAKWPDYRQYDVVPEKTDEHAQKSLTQAIVHYRLSLRLEPDDVKTLLGLGWCMREQGNNADAKSALRKVISLADKAHSHTPGTNDAFHNDQQMRQEATLYLIPLLDPKTDGEEIKQLVKIGKPDYEPKWVTPIVVPTKEGMRIDALMQKCEVGFDIDGTGRKQLHDWPSAKAGWLVWNPRRDGKIDSGLRLIGSSTFWISWHNGYEVLSALDDNNDGQLTGSELKDFALWVDSNSNGKAENGEIWVLSHFGIKRISCKFSQRAHRMWSDTGVQFSSGRAAPSCDWIYKIDSRHEDGLVLNPAPRLQAISLRQTASD